MSEHGPYFPGQEPAECGCYHPDVLRLKDIWVDGGTLIRVVDCVHHGRYEIPLATAEYGHYQVGTVGPVNDESMLSQYRREIKERFRKEHGES